MIFPYSKSKFLSNGLKLFLIFSLSSCQSVNLVSQSLKQNKEIEIDKTNFLNIEEDEENISPPKAKVIPEKKYYNVELYIDNYSWLKNKTNPDVINYLAQENKYTDNILRKYSDIKLDIFREMVDRISIEKTSLPEKIGNYYYYQKNLENKQYPLYCRKKGNLINREEIILDLNEISLGKNISTPGDFKISPDNRYLAFSIDKDGNELYTIYMKDLVTGQILNTHIQNTYGNIEWTNDSKYIYYSILNQSLRPYKIYKHKINRSTASDILIYHETDSSFSINVSKTDSQAFILINSESINSNEIRYLGAKDISNKFKVFQNRKQGIKYYIQHNGGKFYILTNSNAKTYKLMSVNVLEKYRNVSWEEVIKVNSNQTLNSFQMLKNNLVIYFRENGLSKIKIFNLRNNKSYNIDFNEPSYSLKPVSISNYNSDNLIFSYSSFLTPSTTYEYNLNKKTQRIIKEDSIRRFNPNNYQTEKINVISRDGKKIPVSLIYKKDIIRTGDTPLLLKSYGAYGESSDPKFENDKISLIDRGYIYAIAHIRGGGELGINWYEDGKLLNKKNSINDLEDCVESLIYKGYTDKNKISLIAKGAGALSVAALVNKRPELFNSIILEDPFLDILNTMNDKSLPLTVDEYNEWGNPNISRFYNYIKSYSPYDNIKDKNYPNIMITSGINNTVVGIWESAKYIAKIRNFQKTNTVILKSYTDAGHKGKIGDYDYLNRKSLEYSFLLSNNTDK